MVTKGQRRRTITAATITYPSHIVSGGVARMKMPRLVRPATPIATNTSKRVWRHLSTPRPSHAMRQGYGRGSALARRRIRLRSPGSVKGGRRAVEKLVDAQFHTDRGSGDR